MNWFYLVIASVLEVGWVVSLKYTEGFTKIIPLCFYALFGFGSAFFFSNALKSIPMGLAYSIWTGIAVIGTTIAETYMTGKVIDQTRLFFVLLILIGVAGLKLTNLPSVQLGK